MAAQKINEWLAEFLEAALTTPKAKLLQKLEENNNFAAEVKDGKIIVSLTSSARKSLPCQQLELFQRNAATEEKMIREEYAPYNGVKIVLNRRVAGGKLQTETVEVHAVSRGPKMVDAVCTIVTNALTAWRNKKKIPISKNPPQEYV
ncbi:MAG: hypothetical protein QW343_02325 [Candidatus Norongarragalinales archaeon]